VKQLIVLSGKGGTGKTTVVGAFASLAKNKVLADCDVDAADLFIIMVPQNNEKADFYSGRKPRTNLDKCTACGICTDLCRYHAIENGIVDLVECEGCGLCALACPEGAISMEDAWCGEWFVADTRYGPLVHARLGIGEENSGKLVAQVRKVAQSIAEERNLDLVLIDGPPGIGCPVISSLTGVDLVLIVTEQTVAGAHDLERLVALVQHFSMIPAVCINKYDINEEKTRAIERYCRDNNITIVGKIPFDVAVVKAMVEKKNVMEYPCPTIHHAMEDIWEGVQTSLTDSAKYSGTAHEQEGR
jgi:MinD superfamily P-loop ATPase